MPTLATVSLEPDVRRLHDSGGRPVPYRSRTRQARSGGSESLAHGNARAFQPPGYRPVLQFGRSGKLQASNYVGTITTKRGSLVEILPKIDLGGAAHADHDQTREAFLTMLRAYRGLRRAANLPPGAIRALRHFPMLEVFVRLFLDNVGVLVRGGLGRQYVATEENLPFLRGRIAFGITCARTKSTVRASTLNTTS